MGISNVWIIITKSRPLSGCEIDMDGCEFYFSDAFVAVERGAGMTALVAAMDQVKDALSVKKLELVDVLLCAQFFTSEWVDRTDSIVTLHELARKALDVGGVVFSGFRSEEIQELYRYGHTVQEMDE